jgi:hypothetical protein
MAAKIEALLTLDAKGAAAVALNAEGAETVLVTMRCLGYLAGVLARAGITAGVEAGASPHEAAEAITQAYAMGINKEPLEQNITIQKKKDANSNVGSDRNIF